MPEHKPLYPYSLKEAAEWGEKDEWRESYLENCDCARAIERDIKSYIDRYARLPEITAVWIWAEENGKDYEIYIGYA